MTAPESPWLSDDQQRVWRQWLTANGRLAATLGRQLSSDSDLSMADFQVLAHLSEAPDGRLRIVQLAEISQWERSRLSHHLTRMERRGMITRQECREDGRGQFACITAQGQAMIEQAAPGHARAVRRLMFDSLTDADLQALDRVTAGLLERIEAEETSAGRGVGQVGTAH